MEKYVQGTTVRPMVEEDYEKVYELWTTIKGFGIRSMDDSQIGRASCRERVLRLV